MKLIPVDGQYLTLAAGRCTGNLWLTAWRGSRRAGRPLFARVDLSDDRSFLANRYRGLVELMPDLSIPRRSGAGQGSIRIGVEQSACEIHVVLAPLPVSIDLILGRCALELMEDAVRSAAITPGAVDPANNVVDLTLARVARRALAD